MKDVVSSRGRYRRFKVGDSVVGYDGRRFRVEEIELVEEPRWGEWRPRVRLRLLDRDGVEVVLAGRDLTNVLTGAANSGSAWVLGRPLD